MGTEPDQREIIGYSIDCLKKKLVWTELVSQIEKFLTEQNALFDIVFHGTSNIRASSILDYGMEPTDLSHATLNGRSMGSFWGNVRTAASYAEDTSKWRESIAEPTLLAVRTDQLYNDFELLPDYATVDFPLKGLTQLDDPEVLDFWYNQEIEHTWQKSLAHLGAFTVAHESEIDPAIIFQIESLEDVERLLHQIPTRKP